MTKRLFLIIALLTSSISYSQINQNKTGSWHMLFADASFGKSSWGVLGDIQYRNWQIITNDLEQFIARGAIRYTFPKTKLKIYAGYGHFTSGIYGSSNNKIYENRIHQDLEYSIKFAQRIFTNHRLRFEQRFIDGQTFRTRYRYNIALKTPINHTTLIPKTFYLTIINEVFLVAKRNAGAGQSANWFDRNWLQGGFGYILNDHLTFQLTFMHHSTHTWSKNQFLLSLNTKF